MIHYILPRLQYVTGGLEYYPFTTVHWGGHMS